VASAVVAPLSGHVFDLGATRKVCASVVARQAYRLRSDIPVDANLYSASQGSNHSATLLLPRRTFGKDFMAMTLQQTIAPQGWPGRRSILTVVAPGAARSRSCLRPQPMPELGAGASRGRLLLGRPRRLRRASDRRHRSGDLTGTRIFSTAPIEVFAACLYCHLDNSEQTSAAGHLEELMPPFPGGGRPSSPRRATRSRPTSISGASWRPRMGRR